MTDEFPALTTWQQIGFILATPSYDEGKPWLDESDMAEVAQLLDTYKAERDAVSASPGLPDTLVGDGRG